MPAATAPVSSSSSLENRFDRAGLDAVITAADAAAWVNDRRRQAFEAFESLALPDRKSEHWMRTDLRLFKPAAWGLSAPPATREVPVGLLAEAIASGEAAAECFPEEVCGRKEGQAHFAAHNEPVPGIAGRFASLDGHVVCDELDPALAAKGVRFGSAEAVLGELGEALEPHWFSVIDSRCDWFAALHGAFHRGSAVLYVPPGVKLAEPLHVMSAISAGGVDTAHVLVVLGEGADLDVLVKDFETAQGDREACDTAGLSRHNVGRRFRLRGDGGVGRNVTTLAEVFGECRREEAVDIDDLQGSESVSTECRASQTGTASMRSTDFRARSAMAGSMETSCFMSRSASRMFSSVMRFMCGHRLHGRRNSVPGDSTATLSLIEHSVTITT